MMMPRAGAALAAALAWLLALAHARIVLPLVGWWEGWAAQAEATSLSLVRCGALRGHAARAELGPA